MTLFTVPLHRKLTREFVRTLWASYREHCHSVRWHLRRHNRSRNESRRRLCFIQVAIAAFCVTVSMAGGNR